jgi:hypothetical protein
MLLGAAFFFVFWVAYVLAFVIFGEALVGGNSPVNHNGRQGLGGLGGRGGLADALDDGDI